MGVSASEIRLEIDEGCSLTTHSSHLHCLLSTLRYLLLLEDVHSSPDLGLGTAMDALGDKMIVGRLFLVISSWLGWFLN